MLSSRHSRGDVVRLYLDVVTAGAGVVSESPTVAIRRELDSKWFQASDGTWQTTIVQNDMDQVDSTNLPGLYSFDFDQTLDLELESTEYLVRKTNVGAEARTEYERISFGPLAGAAALELCSVQGSIATAQGERIRNVLVRATLVPTFQDGLGRIAQSEKVLVAYTDGMGDFDLPLVRGGIFRLEIPAVGFDRKVTIPDQASALFTDL